jgi:hypothetical protein
MVFSSDQDSGTILIILLHPEKRLTDPDAGQPAKPHPAGLPVLLRRYAAAEPVQSASKCWITDNERNATPSFSFIIQAIFTAFVSLLRRIPQKFPCVNFCSALYFPMFPQGNA